MTITQIENNITKLLKNFSIKLILNAMVLKDIKDR